MSCSQIKEKRVFLTIPIHMSPETLETRLYTRVQENAPTLKNFLGGGAYVGSRPLVEEFLGTPLIQAFNRGLSLNGNACPPLLVHKGTQHSVGIIFSPKFSSAKHDDFVD